MTETRKFRQQELIGFVGEKSCVSWNTFQSIQELNQKAKESSIEMRYGINSQYYSSIMVSNNLPVGIN